MRRQRPQEDMPRPPPGGGRQGPGSPVVATDQSDAILPFLASGGYTFWPTIPQTLERDGVPLDFGTYVAADGAQLVCSTFIPWGKVGFLKEVRVAPLKPSILEDVWNTTGISIVDTSATPGPDSGSYQAQRGPQNTYTAIWDVPMGWESYDVTPPEHPYDPNPFAGGYVPDPWRGDLAWQWQITVLDGSIPAYRTKANIPPFDRLDPTSWYLTESIPVPALVYRNGFPGRPIGVPQRMQVRPGDALHTHAVVPSNSTICLWARWFNKLSGEGPSAGVPLYYSLTGNGSPIQYGSYLIPVIGPSVGSIHGYTQPESSHGSNQNAVVGWGG